MNWSSSLQLVLEELPNSEEGHRAYGPVDNPDVRRTRPPETDRLGVCIRLDWRDGAHEFTGWSSWLWLTRWRQASLERFWLRCPHPERPTRYRLVVMTLADYRVHRRYKCRAPVCPF